MILLCPMVFLFLKDQIHKWLFILFKRVIWMGEEDLCFMGGLPLVCELLSNLEFAK